MADDSFRPDHAERFLHALDPAATGFSFQTFDDREESPYLARVYNGSFEEIAPRLFELNKKGAGVYVTISRTDLAGRKKKNVEAARAVFVDFDGVEPPPGAGALPPSMIVQSRNGKHVYWLIDPETGSDLSRWSAAQEALATKLGGDLACTDWSRTMRLPGTHHCKEDPFLVELVECHPDRRYPLDQIVNSYGLSLAPPPPPKPPPRPPDPDSTFDDFNQRGDWSFLERHGWTPIRGDGDEGRWSRPGREHPGLSATTDHDGHVGIFYVFSSNAAPFEPTQGYSRFQAYSILEHGGDHAAAARDLSAQGFGRDPKEWAKDKAREREQKLLEQAVQDGPPPDLVRPRPRLVSNPPPQDDWVPNDDDVPADIADEQSGSSGSKKQRKRKKKSASGKSGPDLKVYVGGGGSDDPQDGAVDFRVSAVKILNSDPPSYQFEIDGTHILRLTTEQLDSPRSFRRRYLEVIYKRCSVPTGKGSDFVWTTLVNHWLSMAAVVEQPEEASELGEIRVILRGILRDASRGETAADLKRGRVLAHPTKDGRFVVYGAKLNKLVREFHGEKIPANRIAEALRDLGCKSERVRLDSQQFRVWSFKRRLDEGDWCEEGASPQGEIDLD